MAIQCEVCGSSLIKDGGLFVCENCGCKYSLEEVRKMNTGNNSSSYSEDTFENPFVSSYFEQDIQSRKNEALNGARAAIDRRDWMNAVRLYSQVLDLDPFNAEAPLGIAYTNAIRSLGQPDLYVRQNQFSIYNQNLRKAIEVSEGMEYPLQSSLYEIIKVLTTNLLLSSFVYQQTTTGLFTNDNKAETYKIFDQTLRALTDSFSVLRRKHPGDYTYYGCESMIYWKVGNAYDGSRENLSNARRYINWSDNLDRQHEIDERRVEEEERRREQAEEEARKAAEKARMIEEYWEENPDEKKELKDKIEKLRNDKEAIQADYETQIAELRRKRSDLITQSKIFEYQREVKKLETQLASLGFFQTGKKKELESQISSLNMKLNDERDLIRPKESAIDRQLTRIEGKRDSEKDAIDREISSLQSRLEDPLQ